ncbi:MAG: fimbrillin family protein [Muribaculum sp.]|nr:fimbrillin family protein [Muribaculum sp.]
MNTKLMFAALGLGLIATSCSQEEVVSMNPDNAIAFRASTTSSTRGVESTTNNLTEFKVYAYHTLNGTEATNPFMSGVEVSKSGDAWGYTDTQYWPNDGTLDFYSYAPVNAPYLNKGFGAFTVEKNAEDQIDLLYASNQALSKADKTVEVNFRHALSEIVFNAKTTENCNFTVNIDEVYVCKVVQNADGFKFPNSTDPKKTADETAQDIEKWISAETPVKANFYTTFTYKTITKNKNVVELTSSESGAMFLLPQQLEAWKVSGEGVEGKPANQNGAYFLVKCSLKDVANNYIWGSEPTGHEGEEGYISGTKYVAIPLEANWEKGKKYIYTFKFGDGAGYDPKDPDPDPDPDPEPTPDPDPDPVLVPVTFDVVTVDAFLSGNGTDGEDVDMNKK